jgi:D-psicose/D-tagatose/L-ribulose 3-epimerase
MMAPSIWTALYANQPIVEALRWLASCGWRCFELSTEHLQQINESPDRPEQIERVRAALDELEVAMPQAHAFLQADVAHCEPARRQADIERVEREIDCCAELGVQWVVLHPGGGGYSTARELAAIMSLNEQAFRRLGDRAGGKGLKIGIENMMDGGIPGRRRFGAMPQELLDLLDRLHHPALGITLDTSHASVQNLDLLTVVRELGPRIICTHISDNDGSGDQHRTPGWGRINWPAVVKALAEVGYRGLFNLEIPGERHAVPEIQTMKVRWALEVATWLVGLAGGT